ncbi:probable rhamnogalacturonate lyase B [Hibiscus syriacus]|uniref:probable rhamnogalacturonate lyase B n=1 Tax=Hibiscus syriacus TaxID=106335 RepID=UPI00192489EC|nr:probable rhamnogalacturonate lyase B [Hibiscus syriacus]
MDNVLDGRHRNDDRGYWDIFSDHCPMDKLVTEHFEVITRTHELVELSFTKKWNSTNDYHKHVPLNIDKRFIVRRGVPGLYMYSIFERENDFPDASMDHIRIVFKLREDRFRFMALSDSRQRIMPSTYDRIRSQTLAFKEAVVLTNPSDPQLKGEVDDKYQYSIENKDNKLHGWISDDDAVGFWIITPSSEFRAGGPHKQGLTSHPGATSLCMLVTAHYAGKDFDSRYKKGEHWKKVFGPAFIYLNSASSDNDHRKILWMDAQRQLSEEIESWPYNFTRSKDFPRAEQRGQVRGQLLVRDRYNDKELVSAQSAFVVLAAPGDAGSWQHDGKGYQFWTQTHNNGLFHIENVRPGLYNLYAWVHGFIGDYKLDLNITIQPGNKISLGTLIYDPPRNGPTLWEIGIPDRTAAEFFIPEPDPILVNSLCLDETDKYRQYGLWDRYSEIYHHNDLVYTIGTSNYSRDWFFAHVPRNLGNNTLRPTTWQIKYNLKEVNEAGTYTLQLALAAASYAEVQVRLNDPSAVRPYFTTRRIGYDNAVARHGIHGMYSLYSIKVAGNRFEEGENTIFLTQGRSMGAFNAVMYDYIRLEGPKV